jgi:hypothetical protein
MRFQIGRHVHEHRIFGRSGRKTHTALLTAYG